MALRSRSTSKHSTTQTKPKLSGHEPYSTVTTVKPMVKPQGFGSSSRFGHPQGSASHKSGNPRPEEHVLSASMGFRLRATSGHGRRCKDLMLGSRQEEGNWSQSSLHHKPLTTSRCVHTGTEAAAPFGSCWPQTCSRLKVNYAEGYVFPRAAPPSSAYP